MSEVEDAWRAGHGEVRAALPRHAQWPNHRCQSLCEEQGCVFLMASAYRSSYWIASPLLVFIHARCSSSLLLLELAAGAAQSCSSVILCHGQVRCCPCSIALVWDRGIADAVMSVLAWWLCHSNSSCCILHAIAPQLS